MARPTKSWRRGARKRTVGAKVTPKNVLAGFLVGLGASIVILPRLMRRAGRI